MLQILDSWKIGTTRPSDGLLGRAMGDSAERLSTRPSDSPELEFFLFDCGFVFRVGLLVWLRGHGLG